MQYSERFEKLRTNFLEFGKLLGTLISTKKEIVFTTEFEDFITRFGLDELVYWIEKETEVNFQISDLLKKEIEEQHRKNWAAAVRWNMIRSEINSCFNSECMFFSSPFWERILLKNYVEQKENVIRVYTSNEESMKVFCDNIKRKGFSRQYFRRSFYNRLRNIPHSVIYKRNEFYILIFKELPILFASEFPKSNLATKISYSDTEIYSTLDLEFELIYRLNKVFDDIVLGQPYENSLINACILVKLSQDKIDLNRSQMLNSNEQISLICGGILILLKNILADQSINVTTSQQKLDLANQIQNLIFSKYPTYMRARTKIFYKFSNEKTLSSQFKAWERILSKSPIEFCPVIRT